MYTRYYKLKRRAFEANPQPSFIWLDKERRGVVETLSKGVTGESGLQILTGAEGVGKSVLLNKVLMETAERTAMVLIRGARSTPLDFYNEITAGFGLNKQVEDKVQFVLELGNQLRTVIGQGKRPLLAIDDAHTLDQRNLEEVRLLLNMKEGGVPLLSVLLVGENDLGNKVSSSVVLMQHLICHAQIKPLKLQEIRDYVAFRLAAAGAERTIFDETAFASLLLYSGGQPGLINTFCTSVLEEGAKEQEHTIEASFIDWMFGNHSEMKKQAVVQGSMSRLHRGKAQEAMPERRTVKEFQEEEKAALLKKIAEAEQYIEEGGESIPEFTIVEEEGTDEEAEKEAQRLAEAERKLPPLFVYSNEQFEEDEEERSVAVAGNAYGDFYSAASDEIEREAETTEKDSTEGSKSNLSKGREALDKLFEEQKIPAAGAGKEEFSGCIVKERVSVGESEEAAAGIDEKFETRFETIGRFETGSAAQKWEKWANEESVGKREERRRRKRKNGLLFWLVRGGAAAAVCLIFYVLYQQLTAPTIETSPKTSPIAGKERGASLPSPLSSQEGVPLVDMPLAKENLAYGARLNQIPTDDTVIDMTEEGKKNIAIQPLLIVE